MNVYSYARISTDMQSESSIDDQHRLCRDSALKQGWKIAAKFDDVGISGAAFGNRPGILAALAVLKPGDVLLVCDLSRLSRSSDLSPALDRLGVPLISVPKVPVLRARKRGKKCQVDQ